MVEHAGDERVQATFAACPGRIPPAGLAAGSKRERRLEGRATEHPGGGGDAVHSGKARGGAVERSAELPGVESGPGRRPAPGRNGAETPPERARPRGTRQAAGPGARPGRERSPSATTRPRSVPAPGPRPRSRPRRPRRTTARGSGPTGLALRARRAGCPRAGDRAIRLRACAARRHAGGLSRKKGRVRAGGRAIPYRVSVRGGMGVSRPGLSGERARGWKGCILVSCAVDAARNRPGGRGGSAAEARVRAGGGPIEGRVRARGWGR